MKDFKPRPKAKRASFGNTLVGIFIGLLLGFLIAAAIAIYMMKSPFPFNLKSKPSDRPNSTAGNAGTASATRAEPANSARADARGNGSAADKAAGARGEQERPRFDFYNILPGKGAQPAPEPDTRTASRNDNASKAGTTAVKDNFLIQTGAFQNPAEADDMKAKLAFIGLMASVEPASVPDKGTWYRVRLGPYSSLGEVNRIRSQLAQNGIEATLVKTKD